MLLDGTEFDAEGLGHGAPFQVQRLDRAGHAGRQAVVLRPVLRMLDAGPVEDGQRAVGLRVDVRERAGKRVLLCEEAAAEQRGAQFDGLRGAGIRQRGRADRLHGDRHGRVADQGHRGEVVHGVVGQPGLQMGRNGDGAAGGQQHGGTVGRLGYRIGRHDAARARLVVDDHASLACCAHRGVAMARQAARPRARCFQGRFMALRQYESRRYPGNMQVACRKSRVWRANNVGRAR